MTQSNGNGRCRIVLTGGPGGGKTTAVDLFRREIGPQVVVEPHQAPCLAPQRPVLVEDRLGVQVEQQEALEALGARLELRDLLLEASVRLLL